MDEASAGGDPPGRSTRDSVPAAPAEESGNEAGRRRLAAVASSLRPWVARIRAIPKVLTGVLWASVASSLGLAWFWFLRHEPLWVKAFAVPWLALAAAPQLGLWLLASSVRDLVLLPERLVALKSGLSEQGAAIVRRRIEGADPARAGFLRRLRDAVALHGDLAEVLATRAVLRRFTGRFALLIGPVSLLLNGAIILLAFLHILFIAY